nr:MAG TPA: hypothetical protein [Caudoviricetes sp.]
MMNLSYMFWDNETIFENLKDINSRLKRKFILVVHESVLMLHTKK